MKVFLKVIGILLFTGGMLFIGGVGAIIIWEGHNGEGMTPFLLIIFLILFGFISLILKSEDKETNDDLYKKNNLYEEDKLYELDDIGEIELHPNNSEMIIIKNKKIKQIIMLIVKEYDQHHFKPGELEKSYKKIVNLDFFYGNIIKLSEEEYKILTRDFQKLVVEGGYVRIIKKINTKAGVKDL